MTDQSLQLNEIQQHVRDRYAEAALAASTATTKQEAAQGSVALSGCCGPSVSTTETAIDGSALATSHVDGCGTDGCCSDISGTYGLELYDAADARGPPGRRAPRLARLRQPRRRRRAPRGRDRPRPRIGRRDRRPAVGATSRPDRPRDRCRHDRRDARPGAAERGRCRRFECRVPQGHDRGAATR